MVEVSRNPPESRPTRPLLGRRPSATALMDDARAAIASQRATRAGSRDDVDDPFRWMP